MTFAAKFALNLTRRSGQAGMSLIELAVAMGLLLVLVSGLFTAFRPADGLFATQTEAADMQQRLRAALDALRRDLTAAGSGGSTDGGSLALLAPAVLPRRMGLRNADAPDVFRADAITVLQALPPPAVDARLAQATSATNDVTRVAPAPGCPPLDAQCGIDVDDDLLIADDGGAFDVYTVTAVTPPTIALRHNTPDSAKIYPAGSVISRVISRTYFLRAATATRSPQLARYDGGSGPDTPVVDHVVSLTFAYQGDPAPPTMRRPLSDPRGPWTTYGSKPPAADTSATPFLAGSSCLFEANGTPLASPRLPSLAAPGSALVPLSPSQLTDGPWCPDDLAPNRYDADVLRIRAILVSVRVESALDALRGPASVLFTRGGTARAVDHYLPDIELQTRITLPNLALGR